MACREEPRPCLVGEPRAELEERLAVPLRQLVEDRAPVGSARALNTSPTTGHIGKWILACQRQSSLRCCGDAEEIARIELFAGLDAAQREQLSRVAADVSLAAGEYAAHEGADRALFAVLEGRIEPSRLVDGIERVLGERHPGEIFGEVPIALGTVFPVGFRAAEPSRVMRIEPQDYHALAAVVPDVAKEVGRLAAHRMSGSRGLQGLRGAATAARDRGGPRWDPSCAELRRFLDRNQVIVQVAHARGRARCRGRVGRPLPAEADCRRSASSTARRWSGHSTAASRSCSASAPSRWPRSTTP